MKRILLCLLVICLLACCISCNEKNQNAPSGNDEIPGVNVVSDKIIVTETNDSYIVGKTTKNNNIVSIPNWLDVELSAGDIVTVYHNGYILEIEPVQFGYIFYIEYVSNGELIKISNPTNNQIQIPNNNSNTTNSPDDSELSKIDTASFSTYINDEIYEKTIGLSDAAVMAKCFQNMLDGTSFVCNCMPDYTITINGIEYYYHSESGVAFDSSDSHHYLVNNKEQVNEIIEKYLP